MHTNACSVMLDDLLRNLGSSSSYAGAATRSIEHLATCDICQDRLHSLVGALDGEEDALTCDDCQAEIPDLVQARLMGETYVRKVLLDRHLTACSYCAGQYAELLSLMQKDSEGVVTTPQHIPSPDLSFLPERGFSARMNDLGQLVVDFSQGLLQALVLPTEPALVTRETSQQGKEIGFLAVEEENQDLAIIITVYEEPDDLSLCKILAEVALSGLAWPNLGGSQVVLRITDEPHASKETDAFGKAYFERVARSDLDKISFEIEPRRT